MKPPFGFRLKRAAKLAVAQTLYSTGLLQLWLRRLLRHRAVVLMYHRVLTPAEWQARQNLQDSR